MLEIIIGVSVVLWLFYRYYTYIYGEFDKKGIPVIEGRFPFGSSVQFSLALKYSGHALNDLYLKAKPHSYVGIYNMRTPSILVRDPEFIALVLAKEFSHFRDRLGMDIPKKDPLAHHLFNLEGERWRALRVKLSPTFTSGKLKGMFPLFVSCTQGLDNLLMSNLESDVDIKEVFARFTTDIICSAAFGLEVDSIGDSENEFRKLSRELFQGDRGVFMRRLRFAMIRAFPFLPSLGLFRLRFTPKKLEEFLLRVISDAVEHRDKNNFKRNDFLDLLLQLRDRPNVAAEVSDGSNEKVQPVDMTIELMTAQCFVFFFAGFETSSSVQSFCLYELALNPDIQERLRKEIDTTIEKHGGVTYQAVQEMEYLDMVVSEAMRKYPTLPMLTRRCTKPLITPKGHKIEKGDRIIIPVWSLHHDPELFPNPEKFDPERFSQENKSSIKPYTYLPFGEGPRICIGMRFGLLQTKMGLITMMNKYKVEPCDKTAVPMEFLPNTFLTQTKGPIVLKITKREEKR